jgi:class I fructose-bisphosphate aldolase
MGRNAFQRPKKEAIELLHNVMEAFAGAQIK